MPGRGTLARRNGRAGPDGVVDDEPERAFRRATTRVSRKARLAHAATVGRSVVVVAPSEPGGGALARADHVRMGVDARPRANPPLVCLAFGRWALGMAHSPVAPCSEAPLGGAVVGPYPPRTVAGRSGVWSPPSSPCCLSESAKRGLEPREGVRGRGRAPRRLAHEARHARSPWAARQPIVHGYVTEQGKAVDRAIEVSVPSAARAFSVPVSRLGLSGGRFSI